MGRYLIEIPNTSRKELSSIAIHATKKIVRVKSYGTEIDVHSLDINHLLEDTKKSLEIRSWREVKEEEPKTSPTINDIRMAFGVADDLCKGERFWEAHTVLESVWRNSQTEIRPFLQAIIQLFASQVQEQMGNHQVALSIYSKVVAKLKQNRFLIRSDQEIPQQFKYPVKINLRTIAESL